MIWTWARAAMVAATVLAGRQMEAQGAVWQSHPIDRTTPEMWVDDSTLDGLHVRAVVEKYLASAAPAWTPYD